MNQLRPRGGFAPAEASGGKFEPADVHRVVQTIDALV